jgi:hypothetical protein
LNGEVEEIIMNIITPRLQRSAGGPDAYPAKTSGAM